MAKKIQSHKPIRTRRIEPPRTSAAKRGYDHKWRKRAAYVLRRDPICRSCGRAASREVDHVIPKRKGGTDAESNLQGLCKSCHSRKTIGEDVR